MTIATSKDTLGINQVIGQKNDTMIVEEDIVVPDIKPDILSSINTNGIICIYKKEILNGKVKIEGAINTYIMYIADDENSSIRSLNTNLDFSQTIEFETIKENMVLEDAIELKNIECKVINGRKVGLRAIVDVNLKAISNEEVEFVKDVDEIKDLQKLDKKLKVNSLLGSQKTKIYAKDTIIIDNLDNLMEIMKVNTNIINKEIKVSYNKILVKADAQVKIMYLTEDNRICSASQIIPVMGFMDMPDITDDNLCDIKYETKNILIKPNAIEEHSIYFEEELEISCNVYQTKELNIIEDLYSPSVNLCYKQKNIQAISQKEIIKETYSIREKQYITEIGSRKIYDVETIPKIINKTILKDRIVYEGELELNFLYESDNTNRISNKSIIIPFNYNMECKGISQTSELETKILVAMQDFVVMPDEGIEIKVDLEFAVDLSNKQILQVIEELSIDETKQNEDYSLIIYFVKSGDTLWNIAKKFRSTIENISILNGIEDENKLSIGQQLFIPIQN